MKRSTLTTFGSLAAALLGAGCLQRPAPPPPPPAAPTQQIAVVDAPKPTAPKCEKLDEGCIASEGTKARIRQSGFSFEPPFGWYYAQEESLSLASTRTAMMAVTTHDVGAAKKEGQIRLAAVDLLLTRMGLTKKKLTWPKKPDETLEAGSFTVSLWQVEKVARDKVKGVLLVFWATPSEGKGITGAGFVANDDTTKADEAILKAVKSIGAMP